MSIRNKILGGFLIVSLFGMCLGVVGIIAAQRFTAKTAELTAYSEQSDSFFTILNAHYTWRNSLTEAITNGTEFTGSTDPTTCALGNWLHSDEAAHVKDPKLLELISSVSNPHVAMHRNAEAVKRHLLAGNKDAAMNEFTKNILPSFNLSISDLIEINKRYSELTHEAEQAVTAVGNNTKRIIFALIIVVLIASVIFAFTISGMISKPIITLADYFKKAGDTGDINLSKEQLEYFFKLSQQKDEIGKLCFGADAFMRYIGKSSKELEAIAAGDMTKDHRILSENDTMGVSLKKMVDNFNAIFREISASADQVSSGAEQVADAATSLAQGATEQAGSIDDLSSAIAEITEIARDNTQVATETLEEVDKSEELMGACVEQMSQMLEAMRVIDEKSQSISRTTKVIDEIAFQTNILALNAAVEAARAGQHGKGFAVVAEEVRNLAAKSAEAAKETSELIESSSHSVTEGGRIVDQVSESLQLVADITRDQAAKISNIHSLSVQQSKSMEQVSNGIDQVAQVIQMNSATAEESAAASEEMSSQSAILKELISHFRLRNQY